MRIPDTVAHHLHAKEVPFTLVRHRPTRSSTATAHAAHIPERKLAKAIVLEDGRDYCLAVLPATHKIDWRALTIMLHHPYRLVDEEDLPLLFRDCATGAVPAVGEPYGLSTIVESELADQDDLYLEGGDHEHLLHVDHDAFRQLIGRSITGHFSHVMA